MDNEYGLKHLMLLVYIIGYRDNKHIKYWGIIADEYEKWFVSFFTVSRVTTHLLKQTANI